MIRTIYSLLAALCLTGVSCTDKVEYFYSTTQHITRVEAKVVVVAPEKPDPEQPAPTPTPQPTAGEGEATPEDSPAVVQIKEELLAKSPAKAGDSYTFNFKVYNAGILLLQSGEETLEGRFTKVPGSDEMGFLLNGEYHIAQVSSSEDKDTPGTLYTFDFTEEYQKRYPEEKILEAKRLEYIE